MIKKLFNTGVYPENSETLNRKIRVANLIAIITIIVLFSYMPIFLLYPHPIDISLNIGFIALSVFSLFQVKRKIYISTFLLMTCYGFFYMIWGGFFYGLKGHMHYFLIVMCMIVTVLFDSKFLIKFFFIFSITAFFTVEFVMKNRIGLIGSNPEINRITNVTTYTNLLVLFLIICIFILFFKNINLEYQAQVEEKNKLIEEKNKEMTDSIQYALRLQTGLLPPKEVLEKKYPGSFLMFRPKDIVSGDFYWFHENDDYFYLACGDCTGHGVPGALMSVLGLNLLTDLIENKKNIKPALVLETLRTSIIRSLNKNSTKGEYKDGMDLSIIRIHKSSNQLIYAGANNSVYHVRNGELNEFKSTKQPIGFSVDMKPFQEHEIEIQKEDFIFLFTDGYADQFGGNGKKKFMYKPFKKLLAKTSTEHKNALNILENEFDQWKGVYEQIDDVCVIGLKI